jgi:Cytochrome oxidase complex assembly protein 1
MTHPLPPLHPASRAPGRSLFKFLALGCVGVLLCTALLLAGAAALLVRSMYRSEAYTRAVGLVQASPEVREVLGEPIDPGWWVSGSMEVSGPSGSASLSFPVSGPKGEAVVFVEAEKRVGEWRLLQLVVKPQGAADRLDLLRRPELPPNP